MKGFGSSPGERLTQTLHVAAVAHDDVHSAAVGHLIILQGKQKPSTPTSEPWHSVTKKTEGRLVGDSTAA